MSGRPKPGFACPSGWLMNISPAAAPNPTAGSVIGIAIGRKPNFSSRKPLTSSQSSSAERNLDEPSEVAAAGAVAVCALTEAPERSTAIAAKTARMVRSISSSYSPLRRGSSRSRSASP